MIDHLFAIDVPEKSIDGEISSQRVFAFIGKTNRFRMATIGAAYVGTEGRDLHLTLRFDNPDNPELGTDQHRLVEQGIDLLWQRRGGQVEILRDLSQQVITHRSTGQQRAMARLDQAAMNPQHVIGDHEQIEGVAVGG